MKDGEKDEEIENVRRKEEKGLKDEGWNISKSENEEKEIRENVESF